MPTPLDDLEACLSPSLALRVQGKTYTVPPASAEFGLWCRMAAITGSSSMPPGPSGPETFEQRILGSAHGEMVRDAVPHQYVQHCAATAHVWLIAGAKAADEFWKTGGRPDAQAPIEQAEGWRDQYGRGQRDPATGLYEWYDIPSDVRARETAPVITWAELLSHWRLVEADLHTEYGIDIHDLALMRSRPWLWLETRILGLLSIQRSRLSQALRPLPEDQHNPVEDDE